MKVPCRNCKDRKLGCHSECERYKVWQAENEKIKSERRKATESYYPLSIRKRKNEK